MRYFSTALFLIAMIGFVLGFSAYLRTSDQMIEDTRLAAIAAAAAQAKRKHHRHHHPAPIQAGPAEELPPADWTPPGAPVDEGNW